jgi:antitoxin ParD1/3/4/toxin ParE1/3/4
MQNYVLALEARKDLEEILVFIATDSIEASYRVQVRFEEVFRLVGDNPAVGHWRAYLTSRPFRFFPVYSYLVVYLENTNPVTITRILSATRDLKLLLD